MEPPFRLLGLASRIAPSCVKPSVDPTMASSSKRPRISDRGVGATPQVGGRRHPLLQAAQGGLHDVEVGLEREDERHVDVDPSTMSVRIALTRSGVAGTSAERGRPCAQMMTGRFSEPLAFAFTGRWPVCYPWRVVVVARQTTARNARGPSHPANAPSPPGRAAVRSEAGWSRSRPSALQATPR